MGIPVIASPTVANLELAKTVPLRFARTPNEWHAEITQLLDRPWLARQQGKEAKQAVERWTVEAGAEDWAYAWESAIVRRQRIHRPDH